MACGAPLGREGEASSPSGEGADAAGDADFELGAGAPSDEPTLPWMRPEGEAPEPAAGGGPGGPPDIGPPPGGYGAPPGAGPTERRPASMTLPFAGFGARFLGYILDLILLRTVATALHWAAGSSGAVMTPGFDLDPFAMDAGTMGQLSDAFGAVMDSWLRQVSAETMVAWAYFILFTTAFGQTPGKMALGIKVVDGDGEIPGVGRVILRETIGRMLSSIFLALGYFWMLFDGRSQTWHDKIASTYVVRVRGVQAQGLNVPTATITGGEAR